MAADQEDEYVTEPLEGDEGGDEDDKSDMEVDLDANNLEEPETKGATSEEKQEAEL